AEELELETGEKSRVDRVQRSGERPQPFSLVQSPEERYATELFVCAPRPLGRLLSRGTRSREVRNDHRTLRQAPALIAHPLDEVPARTDDNIRELDRSLFVHRESEYTLEILQGDLRGNVHDVAPRAVAEDHEERLHEHDAGLAEPQSGVRRGAEIMRDHD